MEQAPCIQTYKKSILNLKRREYIQAKTMGVEPIMKKKKTAFTVASSIAFIIILIFLVSKNHQPSIVSTKFCDCFFTFNKPTPPKSNIVSTSIFKANPLNDPNKLNLYLNGIENEAESLPEVLPGWIYRIYIDQSFYNYDATDKYSSRFKKIIQKIEKLPHVQIVQFNYPEFSDEKNTHLKTFGSFIRFHAAFDLCANFTIFRNCRNPITEHDAEWIDKWMQTDKPIMLYYTPYRPQESDVGAKYLQMKREKPEEITNLVYGGLWGAHAPLPKEIWKNMILFMKKIKDGPVFGTDESVLTDALYLAGLLNEELCFPVEIKFDLITTFPKEEKKFFEILKKNISTDKSADNFSCDGVLCKFTKKEIRKTKNGFLEFLSQKQDLYDKYEDWEESENPTFYQLLCGYEI